MEGSRQLTYPGDRTASVGQIVGPDSFFDLWKIESAVYNEETDKTTVKLSLCVPPES